MDKSNNNAMASNYYIPQWKKDLILRRRNQSKCQQLLPQQSSDAVGVTGQQPNNNSSPTRQNSSSSVDRSSCGSSVVTGGGKCDACCSSSSSSKMVQERPWIEKQHSYEYGKDSSSSDTDSSEDLHYGPGIVNKLKNRYLSLALRENNAKSRPSILPMRKATSLENLLDAEADVDGKPSEQRMFEKRIGNGKSETGRYRNPVRSVEIMKRSRSIETISRTNSKDATVVVDGSRPKSLHEEMLIEKEGNDSWRNNHDNSVVEKKVFSRLNKPKRIVPVMNEKEKPPADVVKQTKKLFEGRPEQRTRPPHATGEVAAKVATYKSIIVQTKVSKKPLIKAKPSLASLNNDKIRKPAHAPVRLPVTATKTPPCWGETKKPDETSKVCGVKVLTSPIPDVSKTGEFDDDKKHFGFIKNSSLTETPDLILHSSPTIASPTYRIETTRKFLKEEINNYDQVDCNNKQITNSDNQQPDGFINKSITQESLKNISKSGHSVTFNFSGKQTSHSENNKNAQISLTSPLNVDIGDVTNHHESSRKYPRILQTADNGNDVINQNNVRSESVIKSTNPLKPALTVRELEKNLINTVKTLERPSVSKQSVSESVSQVQVPKVKKPPRAEEQQNSIVFKFTDRKDIPDYVGNDGRTRTEKVTLPKVNFPSCSINLLYLLLSNG